MGKPRLSPFKRYRSLRPWPFCWRVTVEAVGVSLLAALLLSIVIQEEERDFAGLEGETETAVVGRVEKVRGDYRERLQAHREQVAALARAVGWGFTSHRTDRPPQTALLALYMALDQRLRR